MTKVIAGARLLYVKWKIVAEKIGNFQFAVIFSVFYFFLVTPLGLMSSLFNDFLKFRTRPTWIAKKSDSTNLKQLLKQS